MYLTSISALSGKESSTTLTHSAPLTHSVRLLFLLSLIQALKLYTTPVSCLGQVGLLLPLRDNPHMLIACTCKVSGHWEEGALGKGSLQMPL